MDPKWR